MQFTFKREAAVLVVFVIAEALLAILIALVAPRLVR
jgi:hypothetical protein